MTREIMTIGVVAAILIAFLVVEVGCDNFRPRTGLVWRCLIATSLALLITALFTHFARAHDSGQWDRGNPTGHAVIFLSRAGYVYCFVQPGGV